jgi:phage baseplate assembly protein W
MPSISSRKYIYSDLDFSLRLKPAFVPNDDDIAAGIASPGSDIYTLTDIDAIKSSVRNLCLTGLYERPFQFDLGTRISQLLFENANPLVGHLLKNEIENVIREYEPRVLNVEAEVDLNLDANDINISIYFTISNNSIVQNVEFTINRIR